MQQVIYLKVRHLLAAFAVLLLGTLPSVQGQVPGLPHWEWQAPRPTGYDLQAIYAFDDQSAIAVGNHGTALKTTDRGLTWQQLNVGTTADLRAVWFVSPLVGWITYEVPDPANPGYQLQGEIRKTTDGGVTWMVQPTGEPRYAYPAGNLQFQSATDGFLLYGLLVPGSGSDPQGMLRHTTDGGQTWRLVGPVPVAGRSLKCQFLNDSVGYAVGGTLMKTTNGGRNWRSIAPVPGLEYTDMSFVDAQTGWVTLSDQNAVRPSTVYATSNGGTTWTPTPVASGLGQPSLYKVAFVDAQRGMAGYYATTNGGQSWTAPPNVLGSPSGLELRPSGVGFATGARGRLSYATSFSTAWAPRDSSLLDGYQVGGLTMTTPTRGWAYSKDDYRKRLLRTTNRGGRWQVLDLEVVAPTLLDWSDSQLVGASFPDDDTVFVAVRTGLFPPVVSSLSVLRSVDAGLTWTRVTVPGVATAAGMRFYDGRRGLLVGARGAVHLTEDGGLTWQQRPRVTSKRLQEVRWATAGTVYVVGDSAAFLRSTDGGRTWQVPAPTLTPPTYVVARAPIVSLAVASPQVAFITSENRVYRLTNGGDVWNLLRLPNQTTIDQGTSATSFCSAHNGWAWGPYGRTVSRTTDAGLTWTIVAILGDTHLTGEGQLVDPYNGWLAGGYGGSILHYSEKFITARPLAQTTFCAGETLALSFDTTGTFPPSECRFKVELSNAQGRFRAGQVLVVGQGNSSPLAVTLPVDLAAGTAYRLRVVQADSLVLGADTGQHLTVTALATASISPAGPTLNVCQGSVLTLSAPANLVQYAWSNGATTPSITVSTAGSYTVRGASTAGCLGPASAPVTVTVVPPPAQPVLQQLATGQLSVSSPISGASYQWLLNARPIAGATQATYPTTGAAPAGTYTVVTTVNGCASLASAPLAVVLATVARTAQELRLYPNPARTTLWLERPADAAPATVQLLDMTGRVAWHGTAGAGAYALPVQQVPAGLYLVRLQTPTGPPQVVRVVVEH